VRSQDAVFVIESVAANPLGRQLAWDFIRERWADLRRLYEGGFLLTRLIQTTGGFASEEKAQVNKFPANEQTELCVPVRLALCFF
jgi:puromycin-sensitive aminopeptidase